jgi:hypothetical protein
MIMHTANNAMLVAEHKNHSLVTALEGIPLPYKEQEGS